MAALPAVLAVATAGASIYGGIAANQAAGKEAKSQREQGALMAENAQQNAQLKADEVRKYAAKQKLQFLANGVDFSGSAILATQDSLNQGQKEVNAIARQGSAAARLSYQEASNTEATGRASIISGFGGAGTSLLSPSSQSAFKNAGWTS